MRQYRPGPLRNLPIQSLPRRLLRPRASGGFSPKSIANLAIWLDAADASTITLNGSDVSQWRDKSGNGVDMSQAVGIDQPEFLATGLNGKPTVRFDDQTEWMSGNFNAAWGSNPFSLFAVGVGASDGGSAGSYFIYNGKKTGGVVWFISTDRAIRTGIGNKQFSPAWTTAEIATFIAESNQHQDYYAWANGAELSGSAANPTNSYTVTGTNFSLGGNFSGGNNEEGDLSEVILYRRALGTEERQAVEAYLSAKWGIAIS